MSRRQTMPQQWLIAHERLDTALWDAVRGLPRGSGVLVLRDLSTIESRRLRYVARRRGLELASNADAARVHNSRELRIALLRGTPLILISPLWPTQSHPDWRPLPRMRAAALARLAGRHAIALGGMDAQRFRRVQRLGFIGWAGISAFRT
jgi:thiamine-phosphate pyrophosphorylase